MSSLENKLLHIKGNSNLADDKNSQDESIFDTNFLVNNLQQIVFQIDTTGRFEYLNSAWEVLTEYSMINTLGEHLIKHVHPKDKIKVEEFLQKICSKEKSNKESEDIRIISKSNALKWTVLRATAIRNDTSTYVTGITGTLTEITEKIRQQELHEAKYRSLQNLLNSYPGMVYRCRNDQHLTIEYVNDTCYKLTGYNTQQFLNNEKLSFNCLIHPDDKKRILNTIKNNLKDGEHYELRHRIITSSEQSQWVLNTGKGNFSSSGELLSFEGMLINFENQYEELKHIAKQALYDPNTGLLSVDLFMNRLEHAIQKTKLRQDYVFSILILSVDQYSQLLGNLGTENCEIACAEISRRIIESLGTSNSVCKIQEDQLGILLDSSKYSIKNITAILSQLQARVQAPMSIAENEIYITASIGVVIGNSKYSDKNKVFSDAQDALNRAKSLGGARYELSDLITHGKAALQVHIETELELALKKDKLLVYWQPIVNLTNNKLAGLEARLVWPHPLRGLLFADQFVPIAEETQLITPLWEWMLKDASRQIEQWKLTVDKIENISLNIQFTGATLLDADSILRLREKLLNVKPKLCNLVVGVSENVLLNAPRTTESMLKPIKGKDIQLLLDDYGSEQTSLALLRDMPIDLIRLDRGLVENCEEDQGRLIKAICSLSRELNISTIAYNVKTEEQLSILKDANVNFAQGDCISIPIDENTAIQTLNDISNPKH